jgi:TonB family protein
MLARVDRRQFVPPAVKPVNFNPILPMEPTIVGTPDEVTRIAGQVGDPNGLLDKLSGGRGWGGGIGDGKGHGIGNRRGDGYGDADTDHGVTGSARIHGAVVLPELLSKTEPEYTEEARRAKLQGTVLLRIEVNERGQVQNVSVRQSLGLGLDERAIEAVRRWRFRPGTIGGKPSVTNALIEVNFRLL